MANLEQPQQSFGGPYGGNRKELRFTEKAFGGASATEALIGAAAAAMAIIALGNVIPFYLAMISVIAVGAALIIEGTATAARFQRLSFFVPERDYEQAHIGGGLSVEVIAGAAGIALGVLALLGIEAMTLLPIAVLVYGAAFLMSGGVEPVLETWVEQAEGVTHGAGPRRERISHQAVNAGAGARALAGIAAAVLGILALAAVGPVLTLTLVALLVLGAAALLNGWAFSWRMSALLHHH